MSSLHCSKRPSLGKEKPLPKKPRTPPSKRRLRTAWRSLEQHVWWPIESACWVASLALFSAIMAILGSFDGRQSPTLKYGITLNTIVSILATLGTFMLMVPVAAALGQMKWIWFMQERPFDDFKLLDEATRGPLGSVALLASRRGGLLAALGAFLTISILAINPFVQQIIIYESKALAVANSTLPTAMLYNSLGYNDSGMTANEWGGMAEGSMMSAVLSSIYANSAVSYAVTPNCQTGNCSWPSEGSSYETLAICSACTDVTHELISNASGHYLPYGFGLVLNASETLEVPLMNVTALRTGTMYTSQDWLDDGPDDPNEVYYASSVYWNNSLGAIYAFSIIANAINPVAAECLLQFCVQSMVANASNGVFQERVLSQRPVNYCSWFDTGLAPPAGSFGPSFDALMALSVFLTQTLSGWVYGPSQTPKSTVTTPAVQQHPNWWSSNEMVAIYRSFLLNPAASINELATAMGQSMTVNMRTRPENMALVQGTAFQGLSVVRVDWPWISMPIALLALTLLLIVLAICSTRKHRLEAWRNDALAMVLHGIDPDVRQRMGPLNNLKNMEEVAEETILKMGLERGSWRLGRP